MYVITGATELSMHYAISLKQINSVDWKNNNNINSERFQACENRGI